MSSIVIKRLGALPVFGLGVIAVLLIASAAAVATLTVSSTSTALTLETKADALQLTVDELIRRMTVVYCHQQYQNNPHGPDDPARDDICGPGPEAGGGNGRGNNR